MKPTGEYEMRTGDRVVLRELFRTVLPADICSQFALYLRDQALDVAPSLQAQYLREARVLDTAVLDLTAIAEKSS